MLASDISTVSEPKEDNKPFPKIIEEAFLCILAVNRSSYQTEYGETYWSRTAFFMNFNRLNAQISFFIFNKVLLSYFQKCGSYPNYSLFLISGYALQLFFFLLTASLYICDGWIHVLTTRPLADIKIHMKNSDAVYQYEKKFRWRHVLLILLAVTSGIISLVAAITNKNPEACMLTQHQEISACQNSCVSGISNNVTIASIEMAELSRRDFLNYVVQSFSAFLAFVSLTALNYNQDQKIKHHTRSALMTICQYVKTIDSQALAYPKKQSILLRLHHFYIQMRVAAFNQLLLITALGYYQLGTLAAMAIVIFSMFDSLNFSLVGLKEAGQTTAYPAINLAQKIAKNPQQHAFVCHLRESMLTQKSFPALWMYLRQTCAQCKMLIQLLVKYIAIVVIGIGFFTSLSRPYADSATLNFLFWMSSAALARACPKAKNHNKNNVIYLK